MSLTRPEISASTTPTPQPARQRQRWLRWLAALLRSWDFYLLLLVVLVAAFLRFYKINTTEFDEDQAMLFRLAYDAVHHGLLPVTSNRSSIGLANPPGVIYLFMLPAALSSNPVWAAVMVGAFSVIAVALTYIFTRRYYGRVAALIASLLFAITFRQLIYTRFIWQPNLMAPFVVLLLFALYMGGVERRKGWLFPALLLMGILYQTHEITLLLAISLLVALVLAWRTVRWRDLVLAVVSLLILFSPFLLWEVLHKFQDVLALLTPTGHHAVLDNQALLFYRLFLLPYDQSPSYPGSVLQLVAPWLNRLHLHILMSVFVVGGFITAAALLLWPWSSRRQQESSTEAHTAPETREKIPAQENAATAQPRGWWSAFYGDPYKRGLVLLLSWQLVPLLILLRHSVDLHAQYFLLFLPGPYILIGLFIAKLGEGFSRFRRSLTVLSWLRYVLYLAVALIIVAQFVGSVAGVLDQVDGNYNDRSFQPYPYHNDLGSLQTALAAADQLAQQRHLGRVYVTTDAATQTALGFLTEQMHTPTTLFDASKCLVLPGPAEGSAVLLVGPYDAMTNNLLSQFANATLVEQSARLAGAPFKLYIVSPTASPVASALSGTNQPLFGNDLQLLGVQARQLAAGNAPSLITRWSLRRSAPSALRTSYSYVINAIPAGNPATYSICSFSSLQAGDQVLAALSLAQGSVTPAALTVSVQSFTTTPDNPYVGPVHLETYINHISAYRTLLTPDGKKSASVPVFG